MPRSQLPQRPHASAPLLDELGEDAEPADKKPKPKNKKPPGQGSLFD